MTNYTPGMQDSSMGDMNNLADIFKLWQQSQMSPVQSLATAIPAYQHSRNLDQYMAPAQQSANAMVDINSPQYQNLYNQQKLQGQQNLAEQIQQLSAANRKLSMMGRTPLFDQQRGGEQLFRRLTKGYQDIQNTAANQTQDLLGRSFATQQALGGQKQQNAASKSSVTGNILGVVAKLFGL